MRLIYVDEAGNTGRKADPDQPIHLIGSLIVDEGSIRPIENGLDAIAANCAGAVSTPGNRILAVDVEFHGADMFGGNGFFKAIKPGDRIAMCKAIIEKCREQGAVFGSCGIDKLKLRAGHPHMRAFQFMLERVQDYLEREGALGLIVADEHRELEEEIIRDLAHSRQTSTDWGYRPTPIINVVDTVHFVKSKHNRLVQACDVLTYFRLKGLRTRLRLMQAFTYARESLHYSGTFVTYRENSAKPSELAVLDLEAAIMRFERFHKLWP